jgi:hypothetical protein
VSCTSLTGVGAFLWELPSLARVTRLKIEGDPVHLRRLSPEDPTGTGLTGAGDRSHRCWLVAAQVGFPAAFSSRCRWLLVPRTSSTPVAMWSWPTLVVESKTCFGSRVRFVGIPISFEKNFYRLPFTPPPPSMVHLIGPSSSSSTS